MTARISPGGIRETGPVIWAFGRLAGRVTGTEPPAIFTTLGRGRGLFWGWLHFAGRLMPGGTLPRRESELLILRTAHLRSCEYEFAHHERLGRRAGVTPEEIERVQGAITDTGWTPRDQALLSTVDALIARKDLTDAEWATLREHTDERTSLEVLLLVGHYDMLATTLMTLRLSPDKTRR